MTLTAAKREVDAMIDAGQPFEEVERYIDSLPVPNDGKAALWLLAWGRQDERVREKTLAEGLVAVAG